MNNEIKEILEFKENADYKKLSCDEIKVLLDYITNLQQELEEYKDTETYSKRFLYKANKDRLNANLKLVEENERLKLEKNTKSASEIICENLHDVYKSRCEKVVEFVKKNCNGIGVLDIEKLLNILEGKEDE